MKFNFKLHCNCARCLRGLSLGVFQEMKPCFARRARQDTCRCRYCDDMSLMLKTLRKNSHLFDGSSLRRQRAATAIQRRFRFFAGRTTECPPPPAARSSQTFWDRAMYLETCGPKSDAQLRSANARRKCVHSNTFLDEAPPMGFGGP